MPTSHDIFQSIVQDQFASATTLVGELLNQRIIQSLDTRKHEMASTLFQSSSDSHEEL